MEQTGQIITMLLSCVLVAWAAGMWLHRRRRGHLASRRKEYMAIVMRALLAAGDEAPHLPHINRTWAKRIVAEAMAGILTATCGLDPLLLRRIVERHGIDRWLLRRIRWSTGYRRALYLLLLGRLPITPEYTRHVARHIRSRNHLVRLHALLVQLSSDPSSALRHLAEYPHRMTALEVAEVMALLRRGLLPVAWNPLLAASNHNLRRVGLAIVQQFGIEDAEPVLWQLLEDGSDDEELSAQVLHALCTLSPHHNIENLARRIAAMQPSRRHSFIRFLAAEGYSATVAELLGEKERPLYESLVVSYKKRLSCR